MKLSIRWAIAACVVVVLVAGWLVDNAIAIRAEQRIAKDAQYHSRLSVAPRIFLGGFPYVANVWRETTPVMSAEMLDVDVPGFGMINARTEVKDLKLSRQEILSGEINSAPAKLVTRIVRLDGVAMGEQLGITDLDMSNPYDISPSGGPSSEVQLTGTPEGFEEPVTVVAKLRLSGLTITMTPDRYVSGPADQEQQAMAAFAWSIDSRTLPIPAQTNRVYCSGGSIYFEAEQRNTTIDATNLSPISKLEPALD